MTITQEQVQRLFLYEPETGAFLNRVFRRPRGTAGNEAGYVHETNDGKKYRYIGIGGEKIRAHRLIWLYMTGEFPEQVDHEDGNGLNNKWDNLRAVNNQQNGMNMRLPANNTSGRIGVSWNKARRKWDAKIKVNQKGIHLGRYTEKSDAIAARAAAELKYGFHPNHGSVRPL